MSEPLLRSAVPGPRLILDIHDVLGPRLKSSTMGTLSVLSTTTEPWWPADPVTKAGKKEGQEKEQDFMDMGPPAFCHCEKHLR